MMKRFGCGIAAIALLLGSVCITPAAQTPLTGMSLDIVGIGLEAGPERQDVPKGIATQVDTGLTAGGFDVAAIIDQLPSNYRVKAELTGPSFSAPQTLTTLPGKPFDIPTLAIQGTYTLNNIRLIDGAGMTLFGAVPQAVVINSIPDPLLTEVKTRPLSLDELQERGVTFDSSNYTAYEFTVGLATESGQVPLTLPVAIPKYEVLYNPEDLPPPNEIGLPVPPVISKPPAVQVTEVPRNLEVKPFMMKVKQEEGEVPIELPPIPGVVVIPGNIGFLHQYFSAVALVSNGAPADSTLVIRDLKAKIILPSGEDLTAGTDSAPGDDPLRMAKGSESFFPRQLPVYHPGGDGAYGTADDVSRLYPTESGQADFTIEGLKEGTHKLDFEITATLDGLPIGPVELTGHASGAVLVRNPDFALTMSHPSTVRAGEEYDLFITVTNTGKSVANLVTVHLDPRALSGTTFVEGEVADRDIETILPGSSATVKYRLESQRTGAVTATVFQSEEIKGRFNLRTGVGENGIPLSPDSLILPYVGDMAPALVEAAVGLLGQAWSIATAPAGALPAEVSPVARQTVTDRAYDLSEAGLRMLIGEEPVRSLEDLTFDYFGSNKTDGGFDSLRRTSTQGRKFNLALASYFSQAAAADGVIDFQAQFADKVSYRPGHLSVVTGSAPVRVRLQDASGNRIGGLTAAEEVREIPFGDQLLLDDNGTNRGTLRLVTSLESASYRLDIVAEEAATFDLGIVLPDASGTLRQARFAGLYLPAGARATADLAPGGEGEVLLTIDKDGDGVADYTVAPGSELAIVDGPPQIVAATQIVPGFGPGGDKHGRNVAVLFSEAVTAETARDAANYAVDENLVKSVTLQPGGRMAFLLLRDGIGPFFERHLTVDHLTDNAGLSMSAPETLKIRATAQGPAAKVDGVVRAASGEPIPGALIRLMQYIWYDDDGSIEQRYAIFSEKRSDADGSYHFDYVLQNNDPLGPFKIEAIDPATGEAGQLSTSVTFHGQQLNLDIFMKARGTLSGVVRDPAGNPVGGATVQVNTLNDGRRYSVTTDAAGGYAFAGISVGAFSLKAVHHPSYSQGTVMGTLPENGAALVQDVTIYPVSSVARGDVSGKVLAADGVTPRGGVVVSIIADKYRNWMYSNADGGFSFAGVYAGPVRIEARDYATGEGTTVQGTLLDGDTSVFNVIMSGTGRVQVRVDREDGKSPEGMYVIADYTTNRELGTTDADGAYTFERLPVGDVRFDLLDPNDYNRTVASASVTLQSEVDAVIVPLYVGSKTFDSGSISGTVYKSDGSIWPFAQVRLADLGEMAYFPYAADAAGHFNIPNLPMGTYNLIVFKGTSVANATATLWYDGQVKNVDLRSFGFGSVTGVVYDDPEKTMPTGADVTLTSMKPDAMGWLRYAYNDPVVIKSDPQTGRFTFNGVYAGSFSVSTSNPFRPTPVKAGGSVTSGQTVNVNLVLQGTVEQGPGSGSDDGSGGSSGGAPPTPVNALGSISGKVQLPDGAPAGDGVKVTVDFGGGADVTATTDAQGIFRFSPIIPQGNRTVEAFDPVTSLRWRGNVSVPAGADVPITIRLLGRGSLAVQVVNADGTAAANVPVAVRGADYPNVSADVITGDDGLVIVDNLTVGRYALSATGSFGRGGRSDGEIAADGQQVPVTVILSASGTVTGTFYKADGKTPIPGGQIKLLRSGKVLAYASSSADPTNPGRFRMDYVPLGGFTLEGFDPLTERTGSGSGYLAADGQMVDVAVTVHARGTVAGVVLNYGGTAPVEKAAVRVSAPGYDYTSVTGSDGTFLFAGVPTGTYTVAATDPTNNLTGSFSGKISYEGEVSAAEVRIPPTGAIQGRVLMPDGETPASNCQVRFGGIMVLTDPVTGGFFFDNLAAGKSYSIHAEDLTGNRTGGATVTIGADGEVAQAEIVLKGVGEVTGIVFDSDGGAPLGGAKVEIRANGPPSVSYIDYTDADGRYRFTDIPAGSFTLKVSHPQRVTAASGSGSLQSEGQTVTVNMVVGPVASIAGAVLLADGQTPAAGGGVKFTGCGKEFTTVIDEIGRFEFTSIPIPCDFQLYMADADDVGIGHYQGALTFNGEIHNAGMTVLDDRPITVAGIQPAADSVNVPVDTRVTVRFAEPFDPKTIGGKVTLKRGSSVVAVSTTYDPDNRGVTLAPNAPLAGFALYTVVISSEIKDLVGRPMPQTVLSKFTTVDNIPPTVTGISPVSGATEVALDAVPRITFNEPVGADSLGGIQLTLDGAPVDVRRDLVQGGTVALLTPYAPLQANATYVVSVSGVRDAVGNALAGTVSCSFQTIDSIAPTVTDLTVPAGALLISGNVVTVTATVADSDVAFVDFFVDDQWVGKDGSAPFTFNALLAQAGVARIKAIAQDKVGNRGAACYRTLDVVPDMPPAVAFVSPAEGAIVDSGSIVTVMIAANDDLNAREVTLSTTGEVMSTQTRANASGQSFTASFSMAVPAAANPGGPIALVAVARDSGGKTSLPSQRTVYVRDGVAPTITLSSPGQSVRYRPGETGSASVMVTDNIGATELACTISGPAAGGQEWGFEPPVKDAARQIVFDISGDAAPHANITLSCFGKDAAGNVGAKNLTLQVADIVPPKVKATNFADKVWGVETDTTLTVTFDEPLDPSTVGPASVSLTRVEDGAEISGRVGLSADRRSISFTPAEDLLYATEYALALAPSIADPAGNPLGEYTLGLSTIPENAAYFNGQTATLEGGWYHTITIINSHVTVTGPIEATSVVLQGSSTLTGSTVEILAGSVEVEAGSKIDVSGRGYAGASVSYSGSNYETGRTLGNTTEGGSVERNGGSYGGLGGVYSGNVNAAYGDLTDPNEYGSGGGGKYWSSSNRYAGGSGGGLIRLTAESLYLEGEVRADGTDGVSHSGGGGSGGGIRLDVGILNGSGKVSACGGKGAAYSGAGGGGRIAIYYDELALPKINVVASGGYASSNTGRNGGAGTIYLKDSGNEKADLLIDNAGIQTSRYSKVTDLAGMDWHVGGGAKVLLDGVMNVEPELVINDSINNFVFADGLNLTGNLRIVNSRIEATGALIINGELILHNQSILGASRLEVQAESIAIDSTSKIDASRRGYRGHYGNGYTLGNTNSGGSETGSGGSYGGYGGTYIGDVNAIYGDLTNPNEPGSGGGGQYFYRYYGNSEYYYGGNGGGVVRLSAQSLNLEGEILADGGSVTDRYAGGGSGGAVRLDVGVLSGSGRISARGGDSGNEGAGGGGRVAIYYDTLGIPMENVTASGGRGRNGYSDRNGGAGTVYLKNSAAAYGDLVVDNDGLRTIRETPIPQEVTFANLALKDGATLKGTGGLALQDTMTFSGTVQMNVSESFNLPASISLTGCSLSIFGDMAVGGDLSMSSATLQAAGLLSVDGALSLMAGSHLTHPSTNTSIEHRLEVQAESIAIDSTSKIDASRRGYRGHYGNGYTLGNTNSGGSETGSGGSYGGYGGTYNGDVNAVYGDLTDPKDPGSSGGGTWIYKYYGQSEYYYGGHGGGVVRLTAQSLTLDGQILADGGSVTDRYAGGGSGGAVRLDVGVLSGSGRISARGGDSGNEGAGGGGRIAIYYDTLDLPSGDITAAGGRGRDGNSGRNGGAGTVYLKNNGAPYGDLFVDNDGLRTVRETPVPQNVIFGNVFLQDGATLKGSGALAFKNAMTFDGTVQMNVTENFRLPASISLTGCSLSIFGDMAVGGDLSMSGATLQTAGLLSVDGALSLTAGSHLTHPSTNTSIEHRLEVQAESIAIDSTSKIDASRRGYRGHYGNGYTLGNTNSGGSETGSGGSYGGCGGTYNGGVNAVYGDLTDPKDPGSSGGGTWIYKYYGQSEYYYGGHGGGVVRLTAQSLTLDGQILAEGGSVTDKYAGGGSGGAIRIDVGVMSGSGRISARGGDSGNEGAGGGGRIAIRYDTLGLPIENITASGGRGRYGYSDRNGGAGTVYLKDNAVRYGDLILDNDGLTTSRTTPIPRIILSSLEVKGGAVIAYTDKTPPQVTGASISDNALDVPLTTPIEVNFNEPLEVDTVTANSVTLIDSRSGTGVPGTISLSGDRATIIFTPQGGLQMGTIYILTVTTAVTDVSHNALSSTYTLNFSTEGADTAAPTVVSTLPSDGALTGRNDIVIFRLIDDLTGVDFQATIAGASVTEGSDRPIAGQWEWSADQGELAFIPDAPLAEGNYWFTIHPTDLAGNGTTTSISFTIYGALADPDGVVAKYTMENIDGDGLTDERGRFNGVIVGATQTFGNGGALGEALEFAPGQYVSIPKEVLSADQFGIAFFERSPAYAVSANGYLLGDSENSLNLFFRRYPNGGLDGETYTGVVGNVNFGAEYLESKTFPKDRYNFIVINKYRDSRVEVFINDIEKPEAVGEGSTFNGLLSDLWLGNRADMQRDYVGRIDQLTIAIRPFDQAARQQLLEEVAGLDTGLVAKYTMDNIIGDTLNDAIGNFDGVIVGASPTPGDSGQALHFVDAENDRVEIPAGIPTMTQGTIALSVKLSNVDSGVLLSNRDGVILPGMFQFDLVGGGFLRLLVHNGEIWSTNVVAATPLLADTQAWVTVIWDGNGKKVYLNGREIASTADAQSLFDAKTNTLIGNLYDLNWGIDGDVDELRVYGRVLSPQQILYLYNAH